MLFQGNASVVRTLNDTALYKEVRSAFVDMGIPEKEVTDLLTVVASVVHLGELDYVPISKVRKNNNKK